MSSFKVVCAVKKGMKWKQENLFLTSKLLNKRVSSLNVETQAVAVQNT